jgi:hypothetical protein
MASRTKSRRGETLTPELQEQLTNYYPLIRKMAFNARAKYRKNLPDMTLDDWRSELTLAAVRMAPCWEPSKGCFGTLIKVGLGNIIKNKVRDYIRRNEMMPMCGQDSGDILHITPGEFADVPQQIDALETRDQARELLDEVRDDIADAASHGERLNLVKDFLGSVQPDWLHNRKSRDIGDLIGATETLVQRARGIPTTAAPEPQPEAPPAVDLPVVEPEVSPAAEAPSSPSNRGKRWVVPSYLPTEEDPFTSPATIADRPAMQNRRRFGLNQASSRWLSWR